MGGAAGSGDDRAMSLGRKVGYVVATLVGLAVGGVLAFTAAVGSLCQTWGEQCTADEVAAMRRMWRAAALAPAATIAAWSVVDVVLVRRWSALRDDDEVDPPLGRW
jgi:hypothetical protein